MFSESEIKNIFKKSGLKDTPDNFDMFKRSYKFIHEHCMEQIKLGVMDDPRHLIPKLYKKNWIDISSHGFILGQKLLSEEHDIKFSVNKSVVSFKKYFGITDNELNVYSGAKKFYRANNDLYELMKTKL